MQEAKTKPKDFEGIEPDSLIDFFKTAPYPEAALAIERVKDTPRVVDGEEIADSNRDIDRVVVT